MIENSNSNNNNNNDKSSKTKNKNTIVNNGINSSNEEEEVQSQQEEQQLTAGGIVTSEEMPSVSAEPLPPPPASAAAAVVSTAAAAQPLPAPPGPAVAVVSADTMAAIACSPPGIAASNPSSLTQPPGGVFTSSDLPLHASWPDTTTMQVPAGTLPSPGAAGTGTGVPQMPELTGTMPSPGHHNDLFVNPAFAHMSFLSDGSMVGPMGEIYSPAEYFPGVIAEQSSEVPSVIPVVPPPLPSGSEVIGKSANSDLLRWGAIKRWGCEPCILYILKLFSGEIAFDKFVMKVHFCTRHMRA